MSDAAISFEEFLTADFYGGPLGGFLRSRALGERLGTGPEFVCGPASAEWWNASWYDRPLIVEPVPSGTCDRIRREHAVEGRAGALLPMVNHWSVPFASDVQAWWSKVAYDHENTEWMPGCRGVAVVCFNEGERTLRIREVRNQAPAIG